MNLRQKAIDPCKVAIYIRWSTEDQGDGTTLDVQMEGCRHYALSQGWTVSDSLTFVDDGHSGGSLNRPALARLREAVGRGEVDCVVVYKLDRLSRDVPDMIRLIMDEWDGRCYVKSAREPIDTTSQSGKMFFYTLASYAEWERSVIKERTFSGKLRRAQEGRNPGIQPCYGYEWLDGAFQVIPHEADIVRRIFERYRLGYGSYRIVEELNAEGIPFRGGRLWSTSNVKCMLRNEAYKGQLVYGKTTVDSKRGGRKRTVQPHTVRDGVFPVIVPTEEWDLVQQIRVSRPGPHTRTSGRAHSSVNLLTGLLKCGGCGLSMAASQGSGAPTADGKYYYYACEAVQQRGPRACPARRIRQEVLDGVVVGKLMGLYGSRLTREASVGRLLGDMQAKEASARAAMAETEGLLGKVEGKRKKLRAMVLEDALSTEEYRAFVQDIEAEARGLEERRATLMGQLASLVAAQSKQVGLTTAFERLDTWDELSKQAQKELLRTFVQRIDAFLPMGGKELQVNITWRVPVVDSESDSVTLIV